MGAEGRVGPSPRAAGREAKGRDAGDVRQSHLVSLLSAFTSIASAAPSPANTCKETLDAGFRAAAPGLLGVSSLGPASRTVVGRSLEGGDSRSQRGAEDGFSLARGTGEAPQSDNGASELEGHGGRVGRAKVWRNRPCFVVVTFVRLDPERWRRVRRLRLRLWTR